MPHECDDLDDWLIISDEFYDPLTWDYERWQATRAL